MLNHFLLNLKIAYGALIICYFCMRSHIHYVDMSGILIYLIIKFNHKVNMSLIKYISDIKIAQ